MSPKLSETADWAGDSRRCVDGEREFGRKPLSGVGGHKGAGLNNRASTLCAGSAKGVGFGVSMRVALMLFGAFVGSLLGGAAVDLFAYQQADAVPLDALLFGALPGAAFLSWLAWGLPGRKRKPRKYGR